MEIIQFETGNTIENIGQITFENTIQLKEVKFGTNSQIKEKLVLKGGTAINLSVLELPRLSVDIDFS